MAAVPTPTGSLTLDLGTIVTTLLGALILWFLKENTSEKKELKKSTQDLREEVIILKTQFEPIKTAVTQMPAITKAQDKMEKDLQEYFKEVQGIKKLLEGKSGIDFKD